MDTYTKSLIERRALQLAKICEHILLNDNEADDFAGAGFRWGYLILRRPHKYLSNFKDGDLRIDPNTLNEAFWYFDEHIEGPNGLMPEEQLILVNHNEESTNWMRTQSNVITLAHKGRNAFA